MFTLCEKEFISIFSKLCLLLRVKGEKITKSNIGNLLFGHSELNIVNILSH